MQDQILQFIKTSIKEKGFAPTYREIGAAVGLKSTKNVSRYLDKLEQAGRIERPMGGVYKSARAIKIVGEG